MTGAAPSPLFVRRERLWPVALVSLAVHGAFIAAAVLHQPTPRIDLGQRPIVAKLVRLGEKRPENLLPVKEQPTAAAPSPAPAAPSIHTPAPSTLPTPKATSPAPRAAPRPAPAAGAGRDVLGDVLSRVRRERDRDRPVYGDPNGDPRGDASEATPGDHYLALVERTLHDTYIVPATISDRDRMHLKATVVLYIDADGQVLRHAFEERSGNGAFDAALDRAIHAARLPPPPPELRQKYRNEGLGVVYRP